MKLSDIKTGDFLYYTERPQSNYADSLVEIRNVDGVDMAHPLCVNWGGNYINETKEEWGVDMPVASYFEEGCWHPTSYQGGNPAVWMTENFPLS